MAEDKEQTSAPETPESAGTQEDPIFLTNMSVRSLGCKPGMVNDKPILIARILGLASEIKHGEDKRSGNPWTALAGEFAGINLQEGIAEYGKNFRSGKLFLPSGIQEVVEKAVREMEKSANGTGSVRFALDLYSAPAANASKYTYQAKSILQVESVDPITELMRSLPATNTKALPPPSDKKKK